MIYGRPTIVPRRTASLSWLAIVGLVGALFSLATVPSLAAPSLDGSNPLEPGFHAPAGSMLIISPVPNPTHSTNPTRSVWILPVVTLALALVCARRLRRSHGHLGARRAQRWYARRLLEGG